MTQELIDKVLFAGINSPSTVNLQTWSFFPFFNDEWRALFGGSIPFGAQAAVIVCADLKKLELIDTDFKNYPLFFYTISVMNASLAAMNMTLAVESLGMRSIMLSQTGRTGITDIGYLKQKLGLPDLVFPITTLAFGYPQTELVFSPPKMESDAVIHKKLYNLNPEKVKEWHQEMELACRISEKEGLAEKYEKYKKLLSPAERELNDELSKITR